MKVPFKVNLKSKDASSRNTTVAVNSLTVGAFDERLPSQLKKKRSHKMFNGYNEAVSYTTMILSKLFFHYIR